MRLAKVSTEVGVPDDCTVRVSCDSFRLACNDISQRYSIKLPSVVLPLNVGTGPPLYAWLNTLPVKLWRVPSGSTIIAPAVPIATIFPKPNCQPGAGQS